MTPTDALAAKLRTPRRLPEDGKGFSKRMDVHLNFGGDGCVGLYTVLSHGEETPIRYQYDTRKGGVNGFLLDGIKDEDGEPRIFKWKELCAYWHEYLKSLKAKP